jgi:hypothetical protein
MAIDYILYSDIEVTELERLFAPAAEAANDLWQTLSIKEEKGPFHKEIMQEEYGIDKGFKTSAFCRFYKEQRVEARALLLTVFESLPGRKLLLKDDTFVAFHPE